jgi:hypothetical protein
MKFPIVNRFLKASLLILALTCFIGLIAHAPTTTVAGPVTGPPPLRLGLTVTNNTLRPGQTAKVSAQFLDGRYQPVANDGTRLVEFELLPFEGGSLSQRQVTVGAGAQAAETMFTARQPGKVVITARAEGLDPARIILIVTRPAASYLSQLFETVAYAQDFEGFAIDWASDPDQKPQANGISKATFQVYFTNEPPAGTRVRVRVDAPARIIYDGQDSGQQTNISFDGIMSASKSIDVISERAKEFLVSATILPSGPTKQASVEFTRPRPSRILFDDNLAEIMSTEPVRLTLHLADDTGRLLEPNEKTSVLLKPAGDDDPVVFDPPSVDFFPNQYRSSAECMFRLKGLPGGNEVRILAVAEPSPNSPPLSFGFKTIAIRSPVQGITLSGPSEVPRRDSAEFIVKLTDKNGKTTAADWNRRVTLSATYGTFIPNEITIPRGQDRQVVKYVPADTTGKVSLRAESRGLTDGSQEIVLITAVYWLFTAALVGGLIGGAVRYLSAQKLDSGRQRNKHRRQGPQTGSVNWRGLLGTIMGSIASGLFLFLAMKLGLSRALGSLALPLDYGTWLVAFFFGGIGGFAGPAVFERLVSIVLPPARAAQPAPSH